MQLEDAVKAMAEKLLDNKQLCTILSAYQREKDDTGCGFSEAGYRESMAALSVSLNTEQKKIIEEIEKLSLENLRGTTSAGYMRGIYAGFGAFFDTELERGAFCQILGDMLSGWQHSATCILRIKRVDQLYAELEKQLAPTDQSRLLSIEAAWDERTYGVLRHALYDGYRAAIAAAQFAEYSEGMGRMISGFHLLEEELGFTDNGHIPTA